jgi:hypothetical protein
VTSAITNNQRLPGLALPRLRAFAAQNDSQDRFAGASSVASYHSRSKAASAAIRINDLFGK